MLGEAPGRLWKTSRSDHAYGSLKGSGLGVNPLSRPGDLGSGTVHAVYPPSGHCASPRGPPGPPPGSLGPPARPLQSPQWDLRPTSNFSHPAGLQPAGLRKARKKHTKTLNIDLSSSDRLHMRLARSGRIAGGAVPAGACAEKVLAMILKAPGNVAISNEAADAA